MRRLVLLLLAALPAAGLTQDNPVLFGPGLRTRPTYDGSSERTTDVIAVVRYYRDPWFARTTQGMLEGGARWELSKGLHGGVQIAYEQGPRDDDPGASLGVHAESDALLGPVPLVALVRLRRHLDSGRGVQLDARATIGVYRGHGILAGAFAQATWAGAKSYQAYYAVNESGLLHTALGLLGSYDLAPRWMLVASLEQRRLASDAARSAFVSRRSGTYASAAIAYRF